MELIRISNDKIKISLTKAELDAYEITVDKMDYGCAEAKAIFKEIFTEAKEKAGFEAEQERVFVQIFNDKNGGCEIFISKIGAYDKKRTVKKTQTSEMVRFNDAELLINACKSLFLCGFKARSSAYTDGKYFYLVLYAPSGVQLACATEYGNREFLYSDAYIKEHFNIIRENDAVFILSQY